VLNFRDGVGESDNLLYKSAGTLYHFSSKGSFYFIAGFATYIANFATYIADFATYIANFAIETCCKDTHPSLTRQMMRTCWLLARVVAKI
jgi:hypothetical protein